MSTSTLIQIAQDGSQFFWDTAYGVMVTSGFYMAIIGVGCVMGLTALVWWGVSTLFPRRLRR